MLENNRYPLRQIIRNLQDTEGKDVKPTREKRCSFQEKLTEDPFPRCRYHPSYKVTISGKHLWEQDLPESCLVCMRRLDEKYIVD